MASVEFVPGVGGNEERDNLTQTSGALFQEGQVNSKTHRLDVSHLDAGRNIACILRCE